MPCLAGFSKSVTSDSLLLQPAMNVSQDDIDAINKALRLRRRVVVLASQTDPQQQQEGAEADPQPQAQEPASEPSLRPPVLEESPSSLSDGEEPLDAPETIARVAAAAWFDPLNRGAADRNRRLGQVLHLDRPGSYLTDAIYPMTRGTKMVVEVLGILLATALLTLTLSRLFMDVLSHVGLSSCPRQVSAINTLLNAVEQTGGDDRNCNDLCFERSGILS